MNDILHVIHEAGNHICWIVSQLYQNLSLWYANDIPIVP